MRAPDHSCGHLDGSRLTLGVPSSEYGLFRSLYLSCWAAPALSAKMPCCAGILEKSGIAGRNECLTDSFRAYSSYSCIFFGMYTMRPLDFVLFSTFVFGGIFFGQYFCTVLCAVCPLVSFPQSTVFFWLWYNIHLSWRITIRSARSCQSAKPNITLVLFGLQSGHRVLRSRQGVVIRSTQWHMGTLLVGLRKGA